MLTEIRMKNLMEDAMFKVIQPTHKLFICYVKQLVIDIFSEGLFRSEKWILTVKKIKIYFAVSNLSYQLKATSAFTCFSLTHRHVRTFVQIFFNFAKLN